MRAKEPDMSNPTSRRERRQARRRQEILVVAARVFAQKGYRDTKVSEIAAALDIADGTLYNYFPSKRDLLMAIVDKAKTDAWVLAPHPGTLRTREDLISAIVTAYDALVEHLHVVRTLLVEAWSDDVLMQDYLTAQMAHVRRPIAAYIRARIEAGSFRPVDVALVTQMALGMLVAPIVPVLRGAVPPPSPKERRRYAETAIEVLLDGVRLRGDR
jgi:AcrR family transcriptional regulator